MTWPTTCFERVGRCGAANPEREGVVRRQIEIQLAPGDRVAPAAPEGKIESHGLSGAARARSQCQLHPVGGERAPAFGPVEPVEKPGLRRLNEHRQEERERHPFTLPVMMPWM
jgi:hypothetical protein